ncbi:AraC family transcriptional regulator [Mariprofundus ferrooxydans]|uniref:AraC family transcriptional regulator n=1 Tax=Mariprofundus ferrooxydans TaxID=314344 RepID=UPI001430EE22|nr:AraC family transcriptional regulator [Mariprofundus ferrooxydans]
MNEITTRAYAKRFEKVFDYIDHHLADPLDVEQLSRVANFSKFHFHRQFSLYAGISVFAYIRMMRLRRASYRLVFCKEERIIDIALDAGFENPESFSRAFKQSFGQSPSGFRKKPLWQPWNERFQPPPRQRSEKMEVNIVDSAETRVAVLEHRGAPQLVNDSVMRFIEWRKQSGLSPVKTSRTFGLVYDDPATVAPEQFRFDICGEVSSDVPANPQGVKSGRIPGGRCAVIRHHGPHERIGDKIYYLYRDWLPESGEELRDAHLFFHYLNLRTEVEEHELITDIYLPLK